MTNYLALSIQGLGGSISGIGGLGLENKNPCDVPTLFPQTISTIIGVLTAAAIIWFIFQFLIGAIGWINSSGDQKAVEAARGRITHAIIGLIVVFVTLVVLSVIGTLLGVGNILDLQSMFGILHPQGASPCQVFPPGN